VAVAASGVERWRVGDRSLELTDGPAGFTVALWTAASHPGVDGTSRS
jgi:hypothetical protein